MSWYNNDGLYIKIGAEEGVAAKGGTYRTVAPLQITEVKLDLTADATSTSAIVGSTGGQAGVFIPDGVFIEAVEVVAEVAATSGGSATLDIGLVRRDRTTAVDIDGLVAAMALTAIDATGERSYLTKGATGAGALVGSTLTNGGYIVANRNVANFTAGKITIRVFWYKPQTVG